MFKKKEKKSQNHIESLIGASTLVEGDLSFVGGVRIDGKVKGSVITSDEESGKLVLSKKAHIEGQIRVSHAVIDGTVDGPVYGSSFVELLPNAKVIGDVYYKTIEIHLGAVIEGRLVHQPGESEKKVVPLSG
ncbi:MAG: cell shape determination protein CcmA [Proteobacteria bacterium]|nr:cell shape determination protein CcmA [Pseudomonadota bacterium]|tara:strand:+ start:1758 stop:2153 length:396 start_codon:yes stop_codon:yes gene_type:complete